MTKDQTNDTAEVLCLTREVDHLNDCTTLFIDGEELITFHDPAPVESAVHFRQASLWLEAQGMTYLQPIELSRDQMDALRTAAAKTERDALEGLDTLTEERDAMRETILQLDAQRNDMMETILQLDAERDALKVKLDEANAEYLRCFDNSMILARQKDAAIEERDALHAEWIALINERTSLKHQRDVMQDTIRERVDDLNAIRWRLKVSADANAALELERDALEKERDALREERDALHLCLEVQQPETMDLILAAKAKIQEAREAAAAAMPDLSACLSSLDTLDSALREIGGE